MGVAPGDRVAVIMAQRPEAAAALMAVFSVGAVATPLSCEFGPEAIGIRLRDAKARVAIVDSTSGPNVLDAQAQCPVLTDRKSVVSGKSVSVRVDIGGRRIITKKN